MGPETANGWSAGKQLRFPDGVGVPDPEGVALGSSGAIVLSMRHLTAGVDRVSLLDYGVNSGTGTILTAFREWNLTPDLPVGPPDPGRPKTVEWISDADLAGLNLIDENTGQPYDPANYPGHGGGLAFVGLANGDVYVYALDRSSSNFTRVTTFSSGFGALRAMYWDEDRKQLWVVCDVNCRRIQPLEVHSIGIFLPVANYVRPTGLPASRNYEGFAIAPDTECIGGSKPVYWGDVFYDGGHFLHAGTITCTPPIGRAGWSAPTTAKGDFNGDGFGDLAIGAPGENHNAGAVHVFYGSATGITTTGSQFWSQDSTGVADTVEAFDDFGRSLAVGNFNSDGFNDLAIGAPGENSRTGAVHVLYGSATGLTAAGSQQFTQDSDGIPDVATVDEHFGATLAAGNLNTSTVASELVIGAPGQDIGESEDAGIVHVLKGTSTGLKGTQSQVWSQASPGIAENPEDYDRFGSSLAVGDLGGSVAADLAIGVPEEDGDAAPVPFFDSGVVHVLLGSATGITATGTSLWSQNSYRVADHVETGDGFGASLVIGNVGGSAFGDLIVGVPGEDIGGARNAGIIQTIPGAARGPTGVGSQYFSQGTAGIANNPGDDDEFGYSLAVGDFGGDSFLDLAVGAPGESGANPHYGVVHLIPGSASGLTATGSQLWTQNSAGVADSAQPNDRFGAALAAGNYGNSIHWDLAIGAPAEDSGPRSSTGTIHVLPGSNAFLTGAGSKTFDQDSAGIFDDAEAFDAMGLTLGR